jgi:cyclopropane-fatty-acyl-phospholipid synthase
VKAGNLDTLGLPTLSGSFQKSSSTLFDRWALARIRQGVASARVEFALWDGFALPPRDGRPVATIIIKNRIALVRWLWDPELHFGESYMAGTVDIRGDLVALLEEVYRAVGYGRRRYEWRRANDRSRARANVHHHYDIGNEFYRLWLDREMLYTCAVFPAPDVSLEDAQVAKMNRICQKLQLKPGDRIVEAGCGWGSLAIFMARQYGASVRAFNISREQIAFAKERAKREGLLDRVEFVADDYRNIQGTCDVFVSVGMLEHVGVDDYRSLGEVISRSLHPQGRGLLHFIGRNRPAPLNPWIRKRIFPGAYAPSLGEVFERAFEPYGLSVLDVENLRLHYAKTLAHWLARFEEAADAVEEMFDARFVRAWRLYLAGSEASFSTGFLQLFQVVFAREQSNAVPWLRHV